MNNPVPSRPSNEKLGDFARAAVIGFARTNCKKCGGRGRIGFDAKFTDNLHIIPCSCVELMDLETVQKSWEENKKQAQETPVGEPAQ